MFCIKIHKSYRNVIAVCDSDILGKKFEDELRQLDVRENFFKEKVVMKEEILKIFTSQLFEDSTYNIVGENSVNLALEACVINEECISRIQNIPFALKLL